MLILSHRGFHESTPENTIEAFEQAVSLGVDGIETDIRVDANGVPILFHDRHAPKGLPVSTLTHEELSRAVGYRVPTLASALHSCPDVLWDLEIKEPGAVANTLAVLNSSPTSHRLLFTSFHHPTMLEISRAGRLDVGLLVAHLPIPSVRLTDWFPDGYNPKILVWDYETVTAAVVESANALGIRSLVYGVVTQQEHRELLSWNLFGVITDFPQFLLN